MQALERTPYTSVVCFSLHLTVTVVILAYIIDTEVFSLARHYLVRVFLRLRNICNTTSAALPSCESIPVIFPRYLALFDRRRSPCRERISVFSTSTITTTTRSHRVQIVRIDARCFIKTEVINSASDRTLMINTLIRNKYERCIRNFEK